MDGQCPTLHASMVRMKKMICGFADEDETGETGSLSLRVSTRTSGQMECMNQHLMLSPGKMSCSGPKNWSENAKPAKIESVSKGNQR
jgi:hypothetical protein